MPHASVADHRAAVAALLGSADVERVAIDRHVLGRCLAADVVAADDLPRFDSSAMDGYAVRPALPGQRTFAVVEEVAAGSAPARPLAPGEAARVMTGARVPEDTVAVVPVERTDAAPTGPAPAQVTIHGTVEPGQHVRRRGEEVGTGSIIARTGAEMTAALIALARSAGCVEADVRVPTRVAVVATGAELTAPGLDPGPGGIHESNSHMVAALAASAGCVVTRVTSCGDERERLRALLDDLEAAADVDLVVTTGGVSMGAHEVVRQVCEPLDTFRFVHLAMQPGGPQGFGRYGSTPVVCLPGTPVGAFVAFHVLLRPALALRHGELDRPARTAAYRGAARRTRAGKVQFLTGVVHADGTVTVPDGRHLAGLSVANVLIEVPEGVDQLIAGDQVVVHPV